MDSHINLVCENNKIRLTVNYINEEKDSSRHLSKQAGNIQSYKREDLKYDIEL